MKPKVAFIGTGGTISSLGRNSLDIIDYGANDSRLHADEILARVPEAAEIAEVIPVRFRAVPSPQIYFPEWKEIILLCETLVADHPDLTGIVIGHGTATLEETAYFLNLTLKVSIPVVLVGSQRPLSGLSTDGALNLVNAICVAACPASRGRGVLVMLNDEIQAARDVTKTSTARMQTFRTPDFGVLGHVDGQEVVYYRKTERRTAPDTEFDIRALEALPRVDIAYSYAGVDGAAIRAFIAAGAKGIVSAGFAPGMAAPGELEILKEAVAQGIVVVQATRSGSGRTARTTKQREYGFVNSDNLIPQKARLLLALALTKTSDPAEIERIFSEY
ncbi:asparaginase [Terrarubrum flagellatum]|uniref:asparaginase n=1 Tax=Terrirubrum flagellatum TaxID=2895980 RepID=UPI003145241D